MTQFTKSDHVTKWIPVKNISVVWAEAQRGLNEREAKRIADSFDPDAFGIVTVTLPNGNGMYHCIDGQTRVAAVRLALGENQTVPCNVLNASDPMRAADIFSKINGGRSKPDSMDRFSVAVTAGYPTETAVNALITSLGYRVARSGADGTIQAVATCCQIYKRFGGNALRDAILLIRATWGKSGAAMDAAIIGGYVALLAKYKGRIDDQRLIARVQKNHTPKHLLGMAKNSREMFKGSAADNVARILVSTYNTGLRVGRLGEQDQGLAA